MPGRWIAASVGGVEVARYVYEPYPEPFEAPKPYFHPLRTTAGDVVTAFRPHDHRWHKGLQLTATEVSGHNLWGGNTYVRGSGYQAVDNVGSMRPGAVRVHSGEEVVVDEDLTWLSARGGVLATESRGLVLHSATAASWALDVSTTVTAAEDLEFGSPHTLGMAGSGYTGLWWRGPRSFTDGELLTPAGPVAEDDLRGRRADWVAYLGRHDEVDRSSTMVFTCLDDGDAAPHWFVRTSAFAGVNPSWAFHDTFGLRAGESFTRRYRIVIGDGIWDADRVAAALKEAER